MPVVPGNIGFRLVARWPKPLRQRSRSAAAHPLHSRKDFPGFFDGLLTPPYKILLALWPVPNCLRGFATWDPSAHPVRRFFPLSSARPTTATLQPRLLNLEGHRGSGTESRSVVRWGSPLPWHLFGLELTSAGQPGTVVPPTIIASQAG